MAPFMNMCLRTWRHQSSFMLTLARAQYDEKVRRSTGATWCAARRLLIAWRFACCMRTPQASVQELIRGTFTSFASKYYQLTLSKTSPPNAAALAKVRHGHRAHGPPTASHAVAVAALALPSRSQAYLDRQRSLGRPLAADAMAAAAPRKPRRPDIEIYSELVR